MTLANGSIGVLTRVIDMQREGEEGKSAPPKEGRFVEVVIMFTGCKKQGEQLDSMLGAASAQKEEALYLKLLLVKEIIRIEEWEYNLGPTQFIRYLRCENGRLVRITTGDYGY